MSDYTAETTRTVIVRTNLPAAMNRALDHLSVDLGKSKDSLLVEATTHLLALHGRTGDVSMPGGGQ